MSDIDTRIEQFRKMANDDPDNELGHFSLGKACLEAEKFQDAADAFSTALSINPNLSKAYQLLAQCFIAQDRNSDAVEQLTLGVKVANERGDLMPRNEMTQMLKDLGADVPEVALAAPTKQEVGEGEVMCARCGVAKPKMAKPPFKNVQGQKIYENICQDCWTEWIGMGTKVINELRLPLSDPQASAIYDQHMMEFLNLD